MEDGHPNKKHHDSDMTSSPALDQPAHDPRERFEPVSSARTFVLTGPVVDVTG